MRFVSTLTDHINILETHWDVIVQGMNNPNVIMNKLLWVNILNEVDVKVINREETDEGKAEALLNILIRKPDFAYQGLWNALAREDPRYMLYSFGNLFAYYFNIFFYIIILQDATDNFLKDA